MDLENIQNATVIPKEQRFHQKSVRICPQQSAGKGLDLIVISGILPRNKIKTAIRQHGRNDCIANHSSQASYPDKEISHHKSQVKIKLKTQDWCLSMPQLQATSTAKCSTWKSESTASYTSRGQQCLCCGDKSTATFCQPVLHNGLASSTEEYVVTHSWPRPSSSCITYPFSKGMGTCYTLKIFLPKTRVQHLTMVSSAQLRSFKRTHGLSEQPLRHTLFF